MHGLFGFKCGVAATNLWNKRSSQAAKIAPIGARRGCPKPFWPVRCRLIGGAGRLPKRTAVAGQPAVKFNHSPFLSNGGILRTTNHEPRFFPRAEGYSRRCRQFELVAAQRHLSPWRPATCDLRPAGPSGPRFDKRNRPAGPSGP